MLIWILLSVLAVSFIAFIGIFFLALKGKTLNKVLILLVALASGALLGGAFLHLLPESVEKLGGIYIGILTLAGIFIFFVLEKFLHWRHCHVGSCPVHTFAHMNLIGDGLHNFIDGLIIAAAYLTTQNLGIATTFAVLLHEIPQEIGDFGVLVYAGFKKKKALLYNFLSALVAVVGALVGYFMHAALNTTFLLPIAAGGFIYIALTDLIPELHKKAKIPGSVAQFIFIVIGIALMGLLKFMA